MDKKFAISQFKINFHNSIYADDDLLDFYFTFYAGINAPNPQFKTLYHINTYTLTKTVPFNLRHSIVNWFSSTAREPNNRNTGKYIPTLIRL